MISVCLATYNGELYVKEQIFSILHQLSSDDEIIISDDGSTDATLNIIKSIRDNRIRILSPFEKKTIPHFYQEFSIIFKVANNFYNAIKQARGDTIYLCDQDDVWMPNKVELCEKVLNDFECVVHRHLDVDKNLYPIMEIKEACDDDRKIGFIQSLKLNHFQGSCMAFTRSVCEKIKSNLDLLYRIPLSQDHAIGYIIMAFFGINSIYLEPSYLIKYRRHGNNVSPTGEKSSHSLRFKLQYRINDIILYLSLIIRAKLAEYHTKNLNSI